MLVGIANREDAEAVWSRFALFVYIGLLGSKVMNMYNKSSMDYYLALILPRNCCLLVTSAA